MKNLIVLLIVFCLLACSKKAISVTKPEVKSVSSQLYYVDKIDSINSYYIIYATRGKYNFKIISLKSHSNNCNEIVEGGLYSFALEPKFNRDTPFSPLNYRDIVYPLDDSTNIRYDKETDSLLLAKNLQGLCLKE